jgi:hypothetical protein
MSTEYEPKLMIGKSFKDREEVESFLLTNGVSEEHIEDIFDDMRNRTPYPQFVEDNSGSHLGYNIESSDIKEFNKEVEIARAKWERFFSDNPEVIYALWSY